MAENKAMEYSILRRHLNKGTFTPPCLLPLLVIRGRRHQHQLGPLQLLCNVIWAFLYSLSTPVLDKWCPSRHAGQVCHGLHRRHSDILTFQSVPYPTYPTNPSLPHHTPAVYQRWEMWVSCSQNLVPRIHYQPWGCHYGSKQSACSHRLACQSAWHCQSVAEASQLH